jgi:hypothetical protein
MTSQYCTLGNVLLAGKEAIQSGVDAELFWTRSWRKEIAATPPGKEIRPFNKKYIHEGS